MPLATTGNDLANVITANSGNDTLVAGSGIATMIGGVGNDTFVVNNVADVVLEQPNAGIDTILTSVNYVLTANSGNDTLVGEGGNDTFVSGLGNDIMIGGLGSDTYVYYQGNGLGSITDSGGNNQIRLGEGLSLQNVNIRLTTANGTPYLVGSDQEEDGKCAGWDSVGDDDLCHSSTITLTAHMRVLDAHGVEQPNQGMDFAVTLDHHGNLTSPIQSFQFPDGTIHNFSEMLVKEETINGEHISGPIITGRNDDTVYAGRQTTGVWLGSGNDTVYASSAGTIVYGGGGNDYMVGSSGNDSFIGGWGVDVMQGGGGNDVLSDPYGPGVLLGGKGCDTLSGGGGNDFIAGGAGSDTLATGATHSVVAFNDGGGQDSILASSGAANTLSLGGGINDHDLSFSKKDNDLILNAGRGDSMTFKDWYASPANHDFVTLQVIEEASSDFNSHSKDVLRNKKIVDFDFGQLVGSLYAYNESEFLVEQAEAQFAQAEQDLILRVLQAYFDVLVAEESINVAEAQLRAMSEQLALAIRGYKAGTVAITDVDEAKSRSDLARSQRVSALNDLEVKRSGLEKIIGKMPKELSALRPEVVVPKPQPDDPQAWISQARQNNPAVRAPVAALAAAQAEVKRNRAEHLPTLDLTPSYGSNYSSGSAMTPTDYSALTKSRQAGVQLVIPIVSGGLTNSHVAEANANQYKARAELEIARRQAGADARKAYSGIVNGLSQIEALESAVDSSRSAVKGNQIGYKFGTRINTDVLNAEHQLYSSLRDLAQARYDTLFQGLKLKAAAGVLNESDLLAINALLVH